MFTPLSKIQGVKIGEPSTFKHMDQSMKSTLYTEVNECYYFHGAKKGKVLSAKVKEGLDPRLANDNAVFGKAVYMSESSTKADQYTGEHCLYYLFKCILNPYKILSTLDITK